MDEYINRREFLEHMQGTSRYFTVKFDIENFPAADVAPVRHGRWVYAKTYYDMDECNCSLCGQLMTTAIDKRMNFCPNCGAMMGGERKGEANEP